MNPFNLPFALFAFIGFVAVAPVWLWFTTSYPSISSMPAWTHFMVQLVLPSTIALFLASWLTGGAA